ncbi:MAG: hypothetical protein KDB00_06935 [Planctomycetales bacterium]|nr:hypothetical protein [Planctomycetales bacterium]
MNRLPIGTLWVLLVLSVIHLADSPICRAADAPMPSEVSENAVSGITISGTNAFGTQPRAELTHLYDQSTWPLEFRSTSPDWPLVAENDRHALTVTVRSFSEHAGQDLLLIFEQIRVDDGQVVGHEQTELRLNSKGDSEPIPLVSSAPDTAGVYEIRCRLTEKPDRLWTRFTRASQEYASVKTPFLVHRPASESPVTASSQRKLVWREPQLVHRVEPSDWQSPSWIPDGATRLVPNVKRVGESLTPWRDNPSPTSHVISPGESYVGLMKDLQPHQTYQLSIMTGSTIPDHQPSLIRVDFSSSPTFESISQTITLNGESQLDVSVEGFLSVRSFNLLHHPAAGNEFVRVTNEATRRSLSIESMQFAQLDSNSLGEQFATTGRGVTLWIESANWMEKLTADYTDTTNAREYSDATVLMYRLWKASTRLSDHSRWCGYDQINLASDLGDITPRSTSGGTSQQINASLAETPTTNSSSGTPVANDSQSGDSGNSDLAGVRLAVALSATAMTRWTAGDHLKIVHRLPGKSIPSGEAIVGFGSKDESVAISGESSSNPSLQIADALLAQNSRITIYSTELPLSFEGLFRESIHQFTQTPAPVTGVATTKNTGSDYVDVLVSADVNRESTDNAPVTIVTVINSAPWSSQVDLRFSSANIRQCRLIESGFHHRSIAASVSSKSARSKPVLSNGINSEGRVLKLPPTSIANVEIHGNEAAVRLVSWNVSMVDEERTMARLKDYLSEVVGKIGTLALPEDYDELRNGSFEVAGQVGIVGWMHTQFPETAVTLDSAEAIEGTHSIRMTTDAKSADRTWLVSEPIPVPASGRLAVSISTRAGAKSSDSKTSQISLASTRLGEGAAATTAAAAISSPGASNVHHVRVSLEGNRLGKPLRLASEFDVPANGQWQPRRIVLETDQVRPNEIDSLRLTIDSLSVGKLWIDDVHLHDRFPTQTERVALQGKAFLAIQGIQRGSLKPAAILLNNVWSQFILAQSNQRRLVPESDSSRNTMSLPSVRIPVEKTPDGKTPAADTIAPGDVSGSTTGKAVSSQTVPRSPPERRGRESVADRIREWLPKPIRF